MLSAIKKFFTEQIDMSKDQFDEDHLLKVATTALLLEMVRADFEVKDAELVAVASSIQQHFQLSPQETNALVQLADEEAQQATCHYEFTKLINNGFTKDQKIKIIELMWEVAFADNHLEKYEEALVRKIAELIYVSHADYIAAKLKVQTRKK